MNRRATALGLTACILAAATAGCSSAGAKPSASGSASASASSTADANAMRPSQCSAVETAWNTFAKESAALAQVIPTSTAGSQADQTEAVKLHIEALLVPANALNHALNQILESPNGPQDAHLELMSVYTSSLTGNLQTMKTDIDNGDNHDASLALGLVQSDVSTVKGDYNAVQGDCAG